MHKQGSMASHEGTKDIMEASTPKVSKQSGPSVVWLIPLVTLIVGGWLIIKTVSEQGPDITISFKTAEGIEAGKTRVKYKNVDIGIVEEIQFSDDFSNVLVTASFNQGTESFFRRNTKFWVVKPQLSIRGATGLSTLISGAYIEIDPGKGAAQSHFTGLDKQPVVAADEAGKRIVLITQKLRSIDTGSPIYYKGLLAGEVLGYELGNDRQSIYIHAFIKEPFDTLVKGNTRFWNVSGMDISMGADGFNLRTESLQAIVLGGIAFETQATLEPVNSDVENLVFTLYDNYSSIQDRVFTKVIKFMMYFEGSVRGLSIGAPVDFNGIRVGTVLDISLELDSENSDFRIPVLIEIEPERIKVRGNQEAVSSYETVNKLVEKGLRASLQIGSLLTGKLFVGFSMRPDTPVNLSGEETPYPELPTIRATDFGSIAQSAEIFLNKLNKVDIDTLSQELLKTLEGTNRLFNGPEIKGALDDMQSSLQAFRGILVKIDGSNLQETINSGHVVMEKITETMGTFDETLIQVNSVLKPNSPLQYNIIKLTGELEETARSIRSLVDTLERHPQALIFGKDAQVEE
ncbi:MAG: paraquat-inducible protein B [Gammaproteobacteria bacterium]|nr:MAG: paraquat-inducible protein B [Gammaproteobacteria bacterium]